MGYFPNGTSAEAYMATFCEHCVNWRYDVQTDTYGCPVMDLHMINNYALQDKSMQEALSHFIPRDGVANQQCQMFLPQDATRCRLTPDMFETEIPT